MKRAYIFLSILFILLGVVLVLLPDRQVVHSELSPKLLLQEINDPARYLSTDRIAERLIDQDPSIFLIDVRTADEHEQYAIPGAMNIPLEEIMNEEWYDYLDQEDRDIIFYSNGDIYADQAWMLCKRKNYQHIFVMKGGLNCWFETIIQPNPPPQTASGEDFDLYQFRLGARQYFAGGNAIIPDAETEKVIVTRKKKKSTVEGGC